MSLKKKIVLTIYSILIFTMCVVVVPKNYCRLNTSSQNVTHKYVVGKGYQPIWASEKEGEVELISIYGTRVEKRIYTSYVDFARLALQIVGITALFAPLYLIEKKK